MVAGSLALRNHLAVREALRTDPELRQRYAQLKFDLARDVTDIDQYVFGKTDLIVSLLTRAGFTESELVTIRAANQPRP